MLQSGIHHPKTVALARRLSIPKAHAVGILEMLWHATAEYAPRGDIGKLDDDQIAACIEWEGETSVIIEALIAVRYLDRHDTYRLIIHDWHMHCPVFVKTKRAVKEGGLIEPASAMQPGRIQDASTIPAQPNPTQPRHAQPRPPTPPQAQPVGESHSLRVGSGSGSGRNGRASTTPNAAGRPTVDRKSEMGRRVGQMLDNAKRKLDALQYIDALDDAGLDRAEQDIRDALKAEKPGGIIVARWLRGRRPDG